MKIKSSNRSLHQAVKTLFILVALLAGFASRGAALAASASQLLEKGIYTEETKGELQAASEIYRKIVDDPTADRALIAQAQLRLGLCELKQGNKPQAISALENLRLEFPDKDKLLALVGQQMPQLLEEIIQQIEQNYIREVDRSELMETAIRAIIGKLDAQAGLSDSTDLEFLGADQMAQMQTSLDQQIAGVGIVLKAEGDEIVVGGLLPNSPAFKGGIKAGDRIVGIDGTELPGENKLSKAVQLIRGAPGTQVTLRIQRTEATDALNVPLVRDVVRLPSVKGDHYKPDHSWEFMLDQSAKIALVRVTEVGKQTADDLHAAIETLLAQGMKGLVLDLRNNPGGLLEEAVVISDLFVDKGRILTVKGRSGQQVFDAKEDGTFPAFPMVLLVNRKTASAAEIIAACLQDHERALVVGERTVGQGIVRTLLPLKDGIGTLKLPIASYFRPNGKTMNRYPGATDSDEWGVSPNPGFEVVLTDEELHAFETQRSARDILAKSEPPSHAFQDRQLQRATEYLQERLR